MNKSEILFSLAFGSSSFAVLGAFCDVLSSSEAVEILGGVAVFVLLPQLKKLINN